MINAAHLLRDLKGQKGLLSLLETDIRERIQDQPGLEASLTREWQAARE